MQRVARDRTLECNFDRTSMSNTAILLINCPDRKGLVAKVSGILYEHGANIIHADQHQDHEAGLFFMRVEWALDGFALDAFRELFEPIAAELRMNWSLELSTTATRMAIFVSQYLHCYADLLYRHKSGELACEIPLIVSNHSAPARSPISTASRFTTSRRARRISAR